MSQAFVKEGDNEWLHEIAPTMNALVHYLSKENGIRITERKSYLHEKIGKQVYEMSDGFTYYINDQSQWTMLD